MAVIEVGADRLDELRAFLAKEPAQNLYCLGIIEDYGVGGTSNGSTFAFFAAVDDGRIIGTAMVGGGGGLLVPCIAEPQAAIELGAALAHRVHVRGAIGERNAVDSLVKALGCAPARRVRTQRLYVASADTLGPFVCPELRLATRADVPGLSELGSAAIKEAFGDDPLGMARAEFVRRIEARVVAGRTWVFAEEGRLLAKIDVGTVSRHGAELEGLFAVPDARKKGFATKVLGQVSRTLLAKMPRVAMRVDEKDTAACAVCRKVGFSAVRPQRLLII